MESKGSPTVQNSSFHLRQVRGGGGGWQVEVGVGVGGCGCVGVWGGGGGGRGGGGGGGVGGCRWGGGVGGGGGRSHASHSFKQVEVWEADHVTWGCTIAKQNLPAFRSGKLNEIVVYLKLIENKH